MIGINEGPGRKKGVRGLRAGRGMKRKLAAVLAAALLLPAGTVLAEGTDDLEDTLVLPGVDSQEIQEKIDDVSVLKGVKVNGNTAADPDAEGSDANDTAALEVLPGVTVDVPVKSLEQAQLMRSIFTGPRLEIGATNPQVASLQSRLMELEYFENDEVTNFYGPVTEFSVELFQRCHDLQVDGIAGEETLKLLYSDEAKIYTIYPGNIGLDVENMQLRLKELGYFKGTATGRYGDETEKAVRSFQKVNGLFVDAKMGTQSRDVLFSPNAKAAPKPKPATPSGGSSGYSGGSGAEGLVSVALGQLGDRYVWGATGPRSFDCSGLVYYSLNHSGVRVSRFNAAGFSQVSSWQRVGSVGALRRGDLIFFKSDRSSRVSHTGIYLGGGQFVHASSSRGRVVIGAFGPYWRRNFVCGRRVF
jgi:cell wall-associated NlpC family hydrolase